MVGGPSARWSVILESRRISIAAYFVAGVIPISEAARLRELAPEAFLSELEGEGFAAAVAARAERLIATPWYRTWKADRVLDDVVEKLGEAVRSGELKGVVLIQAGKFLQEVIGESTPQPLVLDEPKKPEPGGYARKLAAAARRARSPV